MRSSNGTLTLSLSLLRRERGAQFRTHLGEQDDVADRRGAGEQHGQAIDADAAAARGREAVAERADVVLVHEVGFDVAALALAELIEEALALFQRIVQL